MSLKFCEHFCLFGAAARGPRSINLRSRQLVVWRAEWAERCRKAREVLLLIRNMNDQRGEGVAP